MIRNVLVTSGGTSEPIDPIRSITNKSTGKLGSLIADAFAAGNDVENIYYIHGKGAILPSSAKVTPIEIETVSDLLDAVRELYKDKTIDAVVHAMAVSDYRVKSVVTAEDAFRAARSEKEKSGFVMALAESDVRNAGSKLSSELDVPILILERTPKILPLFRKLSPEAVIIGFKLLSGSANEDLIDTGYKLLLKSGCDYIFANDYSTVSAGDHKGYLINSGRFVFPYAGKENIAKGIAEAVLGRSEE